MCGISATAKPSVVEGGDGEAHALDRDRALLDHVAEELGRRSTQRRALALVLAHARADAVDVALDVVAAERLAGAERRLEVDTRSPVQACRATCGESVSGTASKAEPATVDRGQSSSR